MSRLKLAYIFDQNLPANTAESEQLINTISALSSRDYEVTLMIPAHNEKPNTCFEEIREFYHIHGNFRIEQLHSIYPGSRLLQKAIHPILCATLLRRKLASHDLVYSRNIPAILAALSLGVPAMYDTYRPWPVQYHGAMNPLLKYIFAHSKFIGAALHSKYACDAYGAIGACQGKTLTAYNGYNPAYFEPVLTKEQARAQLGLDLHRPVATYSGRMDPEKGLDSLADIAEKTPFCDFIFIGSRGDGPIEKRICHLENVTIKPWLPFDQLAPYFYASDVLMLPLTTQMIQKNSNTVLPIKIFSYFAAGRAIFAPRAADTDEILIHNDNAWLVQPNSPEAALKSFHSLIQSPELMARLSISARCYAESLTWSHRAAVLDGFIRRRLTEMQYRQ